MTLEWNILEYFWTWWVNTDWVKVGVSSQDSF